MALYEIKNYIKLLCIRIDHIESYVRELMVYNKRREWMTFVNPKLHKMYDEIRSELMESIKEN